MRRTLVILLAGINFIPQVEYKIVPHSLLFPSVSIMFCGGVLPRWYSDIGKGHGLWGYSSSLKLLHPKASSFGCSIPQCLWRYGSLWGSQGSSSVFQPWYPMLPIRGPHLFISAEKQGTVLQLIPRWGTARRLDMEERSQALLPLSLLLKIASPAAATSPLCPQLPLHRSALVSAALRLSSLCPSSLGQPDSLLLLISGLPFHLLFGFSAIPSPTNQFPSSHSLCYKYFMWLCFLGWTLVDTIPFLPFRKVTPQLQTPVLPHSLSPLCFHQPAPLENKIPILHLIPSPVCSFRQNGTDSGLTCGDSLWLAKESLWHEAGEWPLAPEKGPTHFLFVSAPKGWAGWGGSLLKVLKQKQLWFILILLQWQEQYKLICQQMILPSLGPWKNTQSLWGSCSCQWSLKLWLFGLCRWAEKGNTPAEERPCLKHFGGPLPPQPAQPLGAETSKECVEPCSGPTLLPWEIMAPLLATRSYHVLDLELERIWETTCLTLSS